MLVKTATNSKGYTIDDLRDLRNFAAHGHGTSKFQVFDPDLIYALAGFFRKALETYWHCLQTDDDFCNKLASANIVPFYPSAVIGIWYRLDVGQTGEHQELTHLLETLRSHFQP